MRRVDAQIKRMGFPGAFKSLLNQTGSRLTIKNRSQIGKILKKERVLIVANHPAEADVLVLLASIYKREDAYLIANHSFLNILPSLDKNIIPVYINHRIYDKKNFDTFKLRAFRRIHHSEKLDKQISHQKNINSISLAAKKINQGGLVMIFPMAGEENNRFMSGVGHIAMGIKNPKKVKVVMAFIEGTSNWDYFRIVPLLGKLLPRLRITFSKPMPMNQFGDNGAREIAKNMEVEYKRWMGSLAKG